MLDLRELRGQLDSFEEEQGDRVDRWKAQRCWARGVFETCQEHWQAVQKAVATARPRHLVARMREPPTATHSGPERAQEMLMVDELLRTTIRAQVLACEDGESPIRQMLPPQPPDTHDFVYPWTGEQGRALGAPYDFFRTLVEPPDPAVSIDDLLVAVLCRMDEAHGGSPSYRRGGPSAGSWTTTTSACSPFSGEWSDCV